MKSSVFIKQRRLFYAIPAFIVGFGIDTLVRWMISDSFMLVEAFSAGCASAALALVFGEMQRGLPTVDDLHTARLKEEAAPLGLADSHSIGKEISNR
jgi:hypothetical protein